MVSSTQPPSPGTLRRTLTYGTRSERTVALDTANLVRLSAKADMRDHGAILQALTAYRPTTRRTYVSALLNYFRALDEAKTPHCEAYRKALDQCAKEVNANYAADSLTANQRQHWMDWEDLLKLRQQAEEEAKGADLHANEKHLLLSLFTMLPPRRNEYGSVAFTGPRKRYPKGNYYVMGDDPAEDHLSLAAYKTGKTYGRQVIPVPLPLATIVRASRASFPRGFLFERGGEPAGNKHISNLFRSVAPFLGSSLVRKIAKTTWTNLGLPHADKLARGMGHSLQTANAFYDGTASSKDPFEAPMGFTVT